MKLVLWSDVHNEFGMMELPEIEGSKEMTLVLAGDIAVGKKTSTYLEFLDEATNMFAHVVYIPGNHEYYHGSFQNTWQRMKDKVGAHLDDPDFSGYLHMLNDEVVEIDDVVFVCATLWTDFDGQNPMTMEKARSYMNDYNYIRRGDGANDPYKGRLTPRDALSAFNQSKFFIFEMCRKYRAEGKKVVVVTHHGPSRQSIHPRYQGEELNGCYVTELGYDLLDLDDLDLAPQMWVHGHIHDSMDYMVGSTRVRTNPRGYVDYDGKAGPQNRSFDPKLVIEV